MLGLVFDCDGTIADTEAVTAQATIKMFRDLYNFDVTEDEFLPFVGTGAIRYVEGPAQLHGVTIDTPKAVAVRQENFAALMKSRGPSIIFPGVLDLMRAAAADPDWKLAVATSSPRDNSMATMETTQIPLDLFDAYITGDTISHKKPHPEIYLAAAAALNLAPGRCVAVEDAVTGVSAAKAAGMKCIAVTNSFPESELGHADLVVKSVAQLTLGKLRDLIG
ncbi:MAG: HAD family phosphatase [Candidatus Hydrogenedentes bacterium]|nr:HAD family phosphatase [Candidatus Hydrogenedentota bacterium]